MEKPKYFLKTIGDAFNILRALADEGRPMGVADLAARENYVRSKVHRLLDTLKYEGWVDQDPVTRKYSLGSAVLELAKSKLKSTDLIKVAEPYLAEMVEKCGETGHLGVLDHNQVLYLDKKEASHAIGIITHIGERMPLHCTALGKVLLADLDPKNCRKVVDRMGLQPYTQHSIVDYEELEEELALVREQGYSEDNEEIILGMYCLAAPIKNHMGRVEAAISFSVPIYRLTEEKKALLTREVTRTGALISRHLGFQDPKRESGAPRGKARPAGGAAPGPE